MSSKEIDIQESTSSLSEMSSLNDDLDNMHLESGSSVEEMSDDEMDSNSWNEIESESDEEFMEDHGLVDDVTSALEDNTVHPIDCYRHFITDEIIDLMVRETNRYAEQYLEAHDISRRSKYRQWKPTTYEEILKFFGIAIEMGLVQMPQLNHYWSSSRLYGLEIVRSAMPRERFELLLKFLHFSNNNNKDSNQDRMFKLKPLSDLLKERFSSVYIPGSVVSIDESMIPWRGRLLFRQYIPGKAHKYGVKMYKLAATNGYTWNYTIYTGEKESMPGVGHTQGIVMKLLDGLDGCYRTVVADNFYTSISLAKYLLEHDTYLTGTLRSNRIGSAKVLDKDLGRGEVYGLESKDGIKIIRWKDKKDVLMISTRPSHSASVVDSGKTNYRNQRIIKPQVVFDYNEGRQGTDLSDQLSTYYTCLRKSLKWYRKVAFELIFGTALVNSYLIYKENYIETKVTILQFRESLVRSLLLDTPIEMLKPGPRQQSASQSKRKLADHMLEEKEGSARDVRRRCAGCYEKTSRQQQSREAGHAAAKKVKTFCPDCGKVLCLDCFNEKHRTIQ
jgi:hypothetical protein